MDVAHHDRNHFSYSSHIGITYKSLFTINVSPHHPCPPPQSCASLTSSASVFLSLASTASSITFAFSYPAMFSPMSQQYCPIPNIYLIAPSRPASFHGRMTIDQPLHCTKPSCLCQSTVTSLIKRSCANEFLKIRMQSHRAHGILQQLCLAVWYRLTFRLYRLSSRVEAIKIKIEVRWNSLLSFLSHN
jgi:hypothetical protein